MEIAIPLLIVIALGWYLMHLFKSSDAKPGQTHVTPRHIEQMADDPIDEAHRILQSAVTQCRQDHPPAARALLWLAATDGTISKQEARNIFRFCEQQGSTMPPGTHAAIEYLNNGVTLDSSRSEQTVQRDLTELAGKPIEYRAAFLGAAHAICGGNKRISKVKQDFLDRANAMVTGS